MSLVRLLCSFAVFSLVKPSVQSPAPDMFLNDLFQKYGTNNGSMDTEKFKELVKEIGIGKTQTSTSSQECYTTETLLDSFSVNTSLNREGFEKICPALVQQIESKACIVVKKAGGKNDKAKAWGYGFLAVTIISLCSLLGAVVVPFMNKSFYKTLLLFMVSLAVGVLCGSGLFHLIPHAIGLHANEGGYLWKFLTVVGGVYLFFILEYVMKMIVVHRAAKRSKPEKACEVYSHDDVIPGSDIAQVQLEVYNIDPGKRSHGHGHSHSHVPDLSDNGNEKPQQNGAAVAPGNSDVSEKKRIKPVAWMIVVGDGLHNFIDGLAIGVSFSTSSLQGVSTSLAIVCEELPHELGDFAVLLNAGLSYRAAMLFNFLSACCCYVGLVVGLVLGYKTKAVQWIYALAGGMFLYISLVDMLAEATEMTFREGATSLKKHLKCFALQNFGMLLGFVIMLILGIYHKQIKTAF